MNTHHSSESNEHYSPEDYIEAGRVLMGSIDCDPATSELANTVVRATVIYTKETNGFNREWHGNTWLNPPGGICDEDGRIITRARKATKTQPARLSCSETGECGLPPGHKHKNVTSTLKAWWFKLVAEYMSGRVRSAIFVGFNLELQQTVQLPCFNSEGMPILQDFPSCVPRTRMKFSTPEDGKLKKGKQPTHGNIIVYLPAQWNELERLRFTTLFGDFGRCVWPAGDPVRIAA